MKKKKKKLSKKSRSISKDSHSVVIKSSKPIVMKNKSKFIEDSQLDFDELERVINKYNI